MHAAGRSGQDALVARGRRDNVRRVRLTRPGVVAPGGEQRPRRIGVQFREQRRGAGRPGGWPVRDGQRGQALLGAGEGVQDRLDMRLRARPFRLPAGFPGSGRSVRYQARLSVPVPRIWAMADNRLSVRDRELFLAEPHIAALSVSAGEGRGPLTVPIWYQYEPGGEAWVLTEAESRKARLIQAAGRFSLMVDRVAPTVRYVSVEGPVTRTVPGTDELLREITERYLPPEKVPAYIEFAKADLGEQVAIYLRPQRWLWSDLGSEFAD
jgi:hypothetical protein